MRNEMYSITSVACSSELRRRKFKDGHAMTKLTTHVMFYARKFECHAKKIQCKKLDVLLFQASFLLNVPILINNVNFCYSGVLLYNLSVYHFRQESSRRQLHLYGQDVFDEVHACLL